MAKTNGFDTILKQELLQLEGIHHQNPETGADINGGHTYIDQYTNRIFGAPFQLMDSVDRRFPSVNKHVGNEYLRNFILNSPILHIKPGLPKYTGGADGSKIVQGIKELYTGISMGMDKTEALLTELAGGTVFSAGSKLQKRMFGFRETYWQYMSHVNYMCRSMAIFLNLTETKTAPNGTYINGRDSNDYSFAEFKSIKWQDYRMLTSAHALLPSEQLKQMGGATVLGATGKTISGVLSESAKLFSGSAQTAASAMANILNGDQGALDQVIDSIANQASGTGQAISDTTSTAFTQANDTSVIEVMADKVCAVLFMVEPQSFEETLTNDTKDSAVETALDSANEVGNEIAFITGSKADLGMVEGITEFLGDTVTTAGNFLSGLTEPVTGGFVSNLFSGALKSVKGQKMIYPKIYNRSRSAMDYNFTINLSSPYGDRYNYYMNIVVPLMHLIALASPRMMTSNSVASPYLVQAFIPGMCTCQLGIISNMQIQKNPNSKHVSAQGYPLDITVKFTIEELYNAMSISPANDPASFLFNETLNDYMANLAGLQPSVETYTNQRKTMFAALEQYLGGGEAVEDEINRIVTGIEDRVNPFLGR